MPAIIFIGSEGSHAKDGKRRNGSPNRSLSHLPVVAAPTMSPLRNQLGRRLFTLLRWPPHLGCPSSEVGPSHRAVLGQGTFQRSPIEVEPS